MQNKLKLNSDLVGRVLNYLFDTMTRKEEGRKSFKFWIK